MPCLAVPCFLTRFSTVVQERQLGWLLKEYGNAQYVPMNALLAHLQQEIQVCHCHRADVAPASAADGCLCICLLQHVDALESQQPQAPGFPVGPNGYEPPSDSSMGDQPQHKYMRHSFPPQLTSPMKRQVNPQTGLYSFGHDVAMGPGQDNSTGFFGQNNGQ